jgi:hypothetical protein
MYTYTYISLCIIFRFLSLSLLSFFLFQSHMCMRQQEVLLHLFHPCYPCYFYTYMTQQKSHHVSDAHAHSICVWGAEQFLMLLL